MIKNCYIHIPFCEKICSYCDFCKMYYQEKWVDEYLKALEKEIKKTYQQEYLETIYIGGGTPSCLNLSQLTKLFQITSYLKKSNSCEFTVEMNFESITQEKLELMKKYGVNRLSFGLETTHKKHLLLLERTISKKEVKKIIALARNQGFSNINIDLMYALPQETITEVRKDLDFILSLHPEHISCYSLMIEPHTKLGIFSVSPIEEDLDYKMYQMICKRMKKENMIHYEISNYAKKNYESKHNLTYWNNLNYYGFGLGASGYIKNIRYTNTKSLSSYLKGNFKMSEEKIEKEDKMFYEVMLKLRTNQGLNIKKWQEEYHMQIDIEPFLKENLLEKKGNYVSIPENKWYISNEIILRFQEGAVTNEKRRSI